MGNTREITVIAKDRIGLLADVTETLSRQRINIDSVSVESSSRNAIIRLLVKDPENAVKALEAAKFKVINSDALVVGIPDKPGELAKLSRVLADHKINIESMFVMNKEETSNVLAAIKVDDYPAARKILRELKYI
ncbi:MAG: ACT domain-containing protein [Candidatus Micrarchaeota archaeon]